MGDLLNGSVLLHLATSLSCFFFLIISASSRFFRLSVRSQIHTDVAVLAEGSCLRHPRLYRPNPMSMSRKQFLGVLWQGVQVDATVRRLIPLFFVWLKLQEK